MLTAERERRLEWSFGDTTADLKSVSVGISDPYQLLALPRSASADDIKKSFRELAERLRPDAAKNDPKAAAAFTEFMVAQDILCDRAKRGAIGQRVSNGRSITHIQGEFHNAIAATMEKWSTRIRGWTRSTLRRASVLRPTTRMNKIHRAIARSRSERRQLA
jgi:curved DNA-binding protein CbpA